MAGSVGHVVIWVDFFRVVADKFRYFHHSVKRTPTLSKWLAAAFAPAMLYTPRWCFIGEDMPTFSSCFMAEILKLHTEAERHDDRPVAQGCNLHVVKCKESK